MSKFAVYLIRVKPGHKYVQKEATKAHVVDMRMASLCSYRSPIEKHCNCEKARGEPITVGITITIISFYLFNCLSE